MSAILMGTRLNCMANAKRPNQAMERTPNGACGKQCDMDGQPEGGLAGKPGIKLLARSLPLPRPFGPPSMPRPDSGASTEI